MNCPDERPAEFVPRVGLDRVVSRDDEDHVAWAACFDSDLAIVGTITPTDVYP